MRVRDPFGFRLLNTGDSPQRKARPVAPSAFPPGRAPSAWSPAIGAHSDGTPLETRLTRLLFHSSVLLTVSITVMNQRLADAGVKEERCAGRRAGRTRHGNV